MSNRQNLITRRAGPADAEGLAHLHVAVWRQTYAALAPAEALEMLDEANRLPGWQAALAPDAPKSAGGTLIAELDGRAVGFVRYGPASQPELGDAGEVKHLYVLPTMPGGASDSGCSARLLRVCGRWGLRWPYWPWWLVMTPRWVSIRRRGRSAPGALSMPGRSGGQTT
ncbi:MAG: hypothetical protein P8X50_08305 [Maritimibacter sp.]